MTHHQERKKSLSLLLVLALLAFTVTGLGLHALADGSDAALDFGPAQRLAFGCAGGPYEKGDFSYETLSRRGVDLNGDAVPTAIALTWGVGSLDENAVPDIAARAENTGNLRFVCGMTAGEAEGMPPRRPHAPRRRQHHRRDAGTASGGCQINCP